MATVVVNDEGSVNLIGSTSKSSMNIKQQNRQFTKSKANNQIKPSISNIRRKEGHESSSMVEVVEPINRSSYTTLSLISKLENIKDGILTEPNRNYKPNKRDKDDKIINDINFSDNEIDERSPRPTKHELHLSPNRFYKNENKFKEREHNPNKPKTGSIGESHRGSSPLYTHPSNNESVISTKSINYNVGNVIILDSEIRNARKLLLEDVAGSLLNGLKLHIDASGLKDSKRGKRDGVTYFGPTKFLKNGEIINDYLINLPTSEIRPTSFTISYDRFTQKYFLRNCTKNISKENSLIFIKIESEFEIDSKKFFMLGHILVNIEPDHLDPKQIHISIFHKETHVTKKYSFHTNDSPITIGRTTSTINIDHNFMSKRHCTVTYAAPQGVWQISDGFENKKSSQGTWLMLDTKFELASNTLMRLGKSVVKIDLLM